MHFLQKRWRLALMGALTALALSVTFASPAFAWEPGEWGNWYQEKVNNGDLPLATNGTPAEARSGNNLLQAWRGATNDTVWLSFNNQRAFQIYNSDGTSTETHYSPTVVPWGIDSFLVFHTGVDNNIYYTQVYANGSDAGRWYQAAPGQQSNGPVSVTQLGANSYDFYMVYRGVNSDQVWGTWYHNNQWDPAVNIGYGSTPSAPSVAYNSYDNILTVVMRGEENHIWMTQGNPNGNFESWEDQGGLTYMQPTVAWEINNPNSPTSGRWLVGHVGTDSTPYYRQYDLVGTPQEGWSHDPTNFVTNYPVYFSVDGLSIFAIATAVNGFSWYKQAYQGSSTAS